MYFDDMVKTAEKWIPEILEKEKPDLMVGLSMPEGIIHMAAEVTMKRKMKTRH